MKKAVSLLLLVLIVVSCGNKSDAKKEIVVDRILPPQASFYALRRQTKEKTINWSSVLFKEPIEASEYASGFQAGVLFVNWSIASIIGDEQAVEVLTENWVRLMSGMEVEEDAFLLQMKKRIDNLSVYLSDSDAQAYRKVTSEVEAIYSDFREYYKKIGREEILKQATFAAWLEFLYAGLGGVIDNYDSEVAKLFYREQEIDYFIDSFEKDELYKNETNFLQSIKPYLSVREGVVSKEQLITVYEKVKAFRNANLFAFKESKNAEKLS